MAKYDVNGLVILITGSTGGLGSALADAFAAKGAKLALLDLNLEAAEKQAISLGEVTVAKAWQADVCSMESLHNAVNLAAEHFGRIDVIVANAGITSFEPLASAKPAHFDRVIDINLNGVWRTFKAGLPHVEKQQGYLLAISSLAAFFHSPLQASYCASKAGVWALSNSIRMELKHLNVGVGSVHPTFFHTPLMDQTFDDPAGLKLWGGNQSGLWKMVALEEVVKAIVDAVENRREFVVVPKKNGFVARTSGLFRGMIERMGFKSEDVVEAIRLAALKK